MDKALQEYFRKQWKCSTGRNELKSAIDLGLEIITKNEHGFGDEIKKKDGQ